MACWLLHISCTEACFCMQLWRCLPPPRCPPLSSQILMLGGTRFIGVYLARMLVDAGHDVTLLTRGKKPVVFRIPDDTGERARLATCDCRVVERGCLRLTLVGCAVLQHAPCSAAQKSAVALPCVGARHLRHSPDSTLCSSHSCRRVVRPVCRVHQAHCLRPHRRLGHAAAAGQPGL